jgi:hypothetical protein
MDNKSPKLHGENTTETAVFGGALSSRLDRWLLQHLYSSIGCPQMSLRLDDLDTEFFRLWLDSNLVYSGAYFSSPSLTLEEAQIAKMDYICRKLNLQPGERLVDIGCGWGALALHMRYGSAHRFIQVFHGLDEMGLADDDVGFRRKLHDHRFDLQHGSSPL